MKNGIEKRIRAQSLSAGDWDRIYFRAEELMQGHQFGCSTSLMLAFQETLGQDILPTEAVAIASIFRGGFGGAGCVCGALAAAQMVLGVFFGYYGNSSAFLVGGLIAREISSGICRNG